MSTFFSFQDKIFLYMEVWVKQNHIYSEGIPGGGNGNRNFVSKN